MKGEGPISIFQIVIVFLLVLVAVVAVLYLFWPAGKQAASSFGSEIAQNFPFGLG